MVVALEDVCDPQADRPRSLLTPLNWNPASDSCGLGRNPFLYSDHWYNAAYPARLLSSNHTKTLQIVAPAEEQPHANYAESISAKGTSPYLQ